MTGQDVFDLIRQQQEAAVADMQQAFDRQLFQSEAPELFQAISYTPTRWWVRRWRRVRAYLTVLWSALKGQDPYTPDDY